MSGGQVMVVLIVLIVMIASIVKTRLGSLNADRHGQHGGGNHVDSAENRRLREEVSSLKERLAVLERITIEKENSLEREIEQLRDR